MARLRHVINAKRVCDKRNSVVYSDMTNELFPSNEQEMNEQDEVFREKTISEEQFNDLVRERARNSKYSCCQTAWFSAKSKVEKDLKEKGIKVK